jgi:hypothetical protein
LAALVAAWPTLSDHIRAAIWALVSTAGVAPVGLKSYRNPD